MVMAPGGRFALFFAPEVVFDLRAIDRKHHSLLRREIALRLRSQPEVETRNRKPHDLPAPFGARWELRLGPNNCFRVFYEVDRESLIVTVLAIGVKERNVLRVGREEFDV
jgi:mRNA-degrading endonuclease RelE of RelBE toxin-antitoxin system